MSDKIVVTTNIILLELLQGCKSKKEYDTLKSRLDILPCYSLAEHTWAIAKENAFALLHHDDHLKVISREMGVQAIDFIKA
jgi:hypothetical protein